MVPETISDLSSRNYQCFRTIKAMDTWTSPTNSNLNASLMLLEQRAGAPGATHAFVVLYDNRGLMRKPGLLHRLRRAGGGRYRLAVTEAF